MKVLMCVCRRGSEILMMETEGTGEVLRMVDDRVLSSGVYRSRRAWPNTLLVLVKLC